MHKLGSGINALEKKRDPEVNEIPPDETGENFRKKIEHVDDPLSEVGENVDDIQNMTLEQLRARTRENIRKYRKEINEGKETEEAEEVKGIAEPKINELSEKEINEQQVKEINDALERIFYGEKLTVNELGNLGEMMMDRYYISQGYKPLNKHRVTKLDDKKEGFRTGIDGVYENKNEAKQYVIADAKYGTAHLIDTNDGRQMSDNWIDGRLDDAVGEEKADEIRDAYIDDPDSVSREVYHIDPNPDANGTIRTDTQQIDADGNRFGGKNVTEYIDKNGNVTFPNQDGKGYV